MLNRFIKASSTYKDLHDEASEEYAHRCQLQKEVRFLGWLVKQQELYMIRNGISPEQFTEWLEQKNERRLN